MGIFGDLLFRGVEALGKLSDENETICLACNEINEKMAQCCKKCGSRSLKNHHEEKMEKGRAKYAEKKREDLIRGDAESIERLSQEYYNNLGNNKYCPKCKISMSPEHQFCTACTQPSVKSSPPDVVRTMLTDSYWDFITILRNQDSFLRKIGNAVSKSYLTTLLNELQPGHRKNIMENDNPIVIGIGKVFGGMVGSYQLLTDPYSHDFGGKKYCGFCGTSLIEWYETGKTCSGKKTKSK